MPTDELQRGGKEGDIMSRNRRIANGTMKKSRGASVSFANGKGDLDHNNRNHIKDNVDPALSYLNVIIKQEPLEDAYDKCYGQALKKFNAKQTRPDRIRESYLDFIKHSKNGEKPYYEAIVQIGDKESAKQGNNRELYKEILIKYAEEFQKRNPNLYMFNAIIHMDEEGGPHLHVNYIPVASGYKRGMEVRNSLDKAFVQQGIEPTRHENDTATMHWQAREREYVHQLCHERGIDTKVITAKERSNMSVEEYKFNINQINKRIQNNGVDFGNLEARPNKLNKKEIIVNAEEYENATEQAKNYKELARINEEQADIQRQCVIEQSKELSTYKEIAALHGISEDFVYYRRQAALDMAKENGQKLKERNNSKGENYHDTPYYQ